jgi:hypothetical protein
VNDKEDVFSSDHTTVHPALVRKSEVFDLKKELTKVLNILNRYNGVSDFIDDKDKEEVKYYWDIVELCRDIKKRMESIYEKP